MKYLLFIGLGGAFGAVSRYLLSNWAHALWEGRWPVGTLLVNMLGSFLIGIVFVLIERQLIHPDWRSVLMVGFLGAFTTFSTFSVDSANLFQNGQGAAGILNILSSNLLGIAFVFIGQSVAGGLN